MNLCARFLLVLILIALYGCSTNLYYIDKAIKTYPGPELPLDELSVLFHDTCLDQRMVLTQIDGQKIRTCSPIALLPGKHLLELVYRYEVTRAPFESRCSDPSKKPWECLGEITYLEGKSHLFIVPCQMEPGKGYEIISNLTGITATGYCIPSSGKEVKGQYQPDFE